jgi:hypothetical protein
MNKKDSIAKSIAIYKERINQVNEKLKEPSLSERQKSMYESERNIASEELAKIETAK